MLCGLLAAEIVAIVSGVAERSALLASHPMSQSPAPCRRLRHTTQALQGWSRFFCPEALAPRRAEDTIPSSFHWNCRACSHQAGNSCGIVNTGPGAGHFLSDDNWEEYVPVLKEQFASTNKGAMALFNCFEKMPVCTTSGVITRWNLGNLREPGVSF